MTSVTAWRLTRARFADLTGEGARRYGGRWNSPGRAVVYLSENAALPVLEVLVHLDLGPEFFPDDYVLMGIDLEPLAAAGDGWLEDVPDLPDSERDCRSLGDEWQAFARAPILRVPSTIVPESRSLLLNPGHPLVERLGEPSIRPFAFDARLLRLDRK